MKTTLKLFMLYLTVNAGICYAGLMGAYPGLDKAIDQADAIAIVRIEGQISPTGIDCDCKQQCFVYQCLKGDLIAKQSLPVSLYDMGVVSAFPRGSVHLVFLKKRDGVYSSCPFPHAILRLSPIGSEHLPDGDTTQAKIKLLLKHSIDYWDSQWKTERKALEAVIE